jgi:hypothetical protein
MNNLFLISILLIIIIYNIFQTSTFENYESKTSAQYESNKSIEDAKITGFETGFSGSGSNITNDITRLDYKFAKNSDELLELTKYKPYTKENQDNLDVEYHDDPKNIKTGGYELDMGTVMVFDPSLNKIIAIPREENITYTTYNPPNTFKYGSQNYVPTYEDSVKLRLTTPRPRAHQVYRKWLGQDDEITEFQIYKKTLQIIHYGYNKLQNALDTFLINLKIVNL